MDKYSLITIPYPLFCKDNNETVDAIAALIRYLEAENVYFWGQSYGGLLAQIIAKKHPDIVSGLLLTSTASFSTALKFEGMKCIVNMINEEKEAKRVKKYKKMPMGIAMAMFPMMFKKHLQGNKKAYKTIKEYELKEIDRDLLAKIFGTIVPSLFWKDNNDFLENGKGYCISCGDDIVSWAFSAAVSTKEIDIGIETNPKYKKGLGMIVANRMINYALDQGKNPVWACHYKNVASEKMAEKLGFVKADECTIINVTN